MSLYALVKIRCEGISPRRLSCAKLLRAFRRVLRDYLHPVERGQTLSDRLRRSVIDDYQRRNKTSRDYPRKKQETPAGHHASPTPPDCKFVSPSRFGPPHELWLTRSMPPAPILSRIV